MNMKKLGHLPLFILQSIKILLVNPKCEIIMVLSNYQFLKITQVKQICNICIQCVVCININFAYKKQGQDQFKGTKISSEELQRLTSFSISQIANFQNQLRALEERHQYQIKPLILFSLVMNPCQEPMQRCISSRKRQIYLYIFISLRYCSILYKII